MFEKTVSGSRSLKIERSMATLYARLLSNYTCEMTPSIFTIATKNHKLVCLASGQNVISVTSLRHQYDAMVIIGSLQTVYDMLRKILSDITN